MEEVGAQLHASTVFTPPPPRERPPGTHWIGGWVGPRAGLDAVVREEFPVSAGHSARSPAVYH